MNLRKLNEQIEKLLEISDETKKSYLDKRQAQADKANKNLQKAKSAIAKSDERQISNLPQRTSLENAEKALNTLKSEMKKVSNGSDWRLEEDEDGEYLNLSVRYWGQWNDRDEDDDWAPLDDKYKQILDRILVKVQKQHGVQIINQGSEKKWLSFDILLDGSMIDKDVDDSIIDKDVDDLVIDKDVLYEQAYLLKDYIDDSVRVMFSFSNGVLYITTKKFDASIILDHDNDNVMFGIVNNSRVTPRFLKKVSKQLLKDASIMESIYKECARAFEKELTKQTSDFSQWKYDSEDYLFSSNEYWGISVEPIKEDFEHIKVCIGDFFSNVYEWEVFDHFPSVKDIEKFASAFYPKIVHCRIPEIPNKLKQEFINDYQIKLKP